MASSSGGYAGVTLKSEARYLHAGALILHADASCSMDHCSKVCRHGIQLQCQGVGASGMQGGRAADCPDALLKRSSQLQHPRKQQVACLQ